jgi:2-polyprenyl-6-methoxyphenol hydroxylase-like FAD-dependent oxidoreductase
MVVSSVPYVRVFPVQLLQWLELCNTPGTGKITPQPLYEFAADKVVNGRLILMGDSAHMASPRTAAGAHTGILDAAGLLEALSAHPNNIDDAIRAYGPGGLQRARDLYQRSKEVSKPLVYVPGDDDYKREL